MPFTRDEWDAAVTWEKFYEGVSAHAELWKHHWKSAEVDDAWGRPEVSAGQKIWAMLVLAAGVTVGSLRSASHPWYSVLLLGALTVWVVAHFPRILAAFVEPLRHRARGPVSMRFPRRWTAGPGDALAALLTVLLFVELGVHPSSVWPYFLAASIVATWCLAWSYIRTPGVRQGGISLAATPAFVPWKSIRKWRGGRVGSSSGSTGPISSFRLTRLVCRSPTT